MSFVTDSNAWTLALEKIETLKNESMKELPLKKNLRELQELRLDLVGRRSFLYQTLQALKAAPTDILKNFGQQFKGIRLEIEEMIASRAERISLELYEEKIRAEAIDATLPGAPVNKGAIHPINQTINSIVKFFKNCGFSVASGPEIETDYYNFEALNLPKEHPAQTEQDSFWLTKKYLLRTHTSGIQIRTLEKAKPPIKILAPGRVFRPDSDMTHTPMFHQIEGLLIQEDVNFASLKGLLQACLEELFREKSPKVRFRPSDFPFTVPSAEVDLKIDFHGDRWLEVLGCGMVHPKIIERVGLDPKKFKGFAFGMGVERLAMLRYSIPDLRSFYENDLRFLKQFGS